MAVTSWREGNPTSSKERLEIGPGEIASLALLFQRTWQRPPTRQELDGLIEGRVREEVLYREALKLGLDRDDTVVRRRLQQKMEFVGEDLATVEATDAELASVLAADADRFRAPERWSFRQILVADGSTEGAATLLANLRRGTADPDTSGAATLLEPLYRDVSAREVAASLGEDFATALAALSSGAWEGPISSPYGLHLVRVEGRTPARDRALSEIRDEVLRVWQADRGRRAKDELYARLRAHYDVVIAPTPDVAAAVPSS